MIGGLWYEWQQDGYLVVLCFCQFGGLGYQWGGVLLFFDVVDFEFCDWIFYFGWLFMFEQLKFYYNCVCDLFDFEYFFGDVKIVLLLIVGDGCVVYLRF